MSDVPDSTLITNLFYGRYKAQIVRLAIELDIFSKMEQGWHDVSSLAQSCQCHPQGMRLLLNYLTSLGLVKQENDDYALSATGTFFFVPGRSSYVKDWIMSEVDPQIWQGISRAVRDGNPANVALPFASEAWMSIYVEGQLAKILGVWRAIGINNQRRESLRILDLASGCGIKTLALALINPDYQVTLVDSFEVLAAAKYVIDKFNLVVQTQLIAGDALRTPLARRTFELIFMGQITYYWTEMQICALFRNLYEILVRGGMLIIETIMPDQQDSELVTMFNFLLWANVGAALHSFEQYKIWMREAGFTNIRRQGEGIILGDKI